jgi:hypothetical protein
MFNCRRDKDVVLQRASGRPVFGPFPLMTGSKAMSLEKTGSRYVSVKPDCVHDFGKVFFRKKAERQKR